MSKAHELATLEVGWVERLGRCALEQAGHAAQGDGFAAHLRGVAEPQAGAQLDLRPLHTALLHDLRLDRKSTGLVLGLMMFYVQRRITPPLAVQVPPAARAAVNLAMEEIGDLEAALDQLEHLLHPPPKATEPESAAASAAESATASAAQEPLSLDRSYLHALCVEAYNLALAPELRQVAAVDGIDHGLPSNLDPNVPLDLSGFWMALTLPASLNLPASQAGQIVLFVLLSLERETAGTLLVHLPEEARGASDQALASLDQEALAQTLTALRAATAARLIRLAKSTPEVSAKPVVAPTVAAQEKPERTREAPPSTPQMAPKAAPRVPLKALIASLMLVCSLGYWGAYFYNQYYQAKRIRVDLAALSAVIPVKEGRINKDTLIVVIDDATYNGLDGEKQARLGRKLLSVLGKPQVKKVMIISGEQQYRVERKNRATKMQVTPRK